MIPVSMPPEPGDFHTECELPGETWLAGKPGRSPRNKDLWSPFRPALKAGFSNRCGFLGMFVSTEGTVDHYLSINQHPTLAYRWSNYRFSSEEMNRKKGTLDAQILDPYVVGPGWFEILIPSLQMVPTDAVPAHIKPQVDFTLDRLGLRDGEAVIRLRLAWFQVLEPFARAGNWAGFDRVKHLAPLVAEAIEGYYAR